VWSAGTDRTDAVRSALVVDRRVCHLETQLYVNRRRRAFFARIFGLDYDDDEDSTTHGRRARSSYLHAGNEYLDESCRLRMLQARLDHNVPLTSSHLPATATDRLHDESQSVTPQHSQNDDDQSTTTTTTAST